MVETSIIMSNYNNDKFISGAIESVLRQSYSDFELVLIDDASTDKSPDIIEKYCKMDDRVKAFYQLQNMGKVFVRNKGINCAKGRYIAFLDGDDIWLPSKLERQISFLKQENVSFSYSAYQKINSDDQILGTVSVPEQIDYKCLLSSCFIGFLTSIYDSEKLPKLFFNNMKRREDHKYWLDLIKYSGYAYGINEVLAQYRTTNKLFNSKRLETLYWQWLIYRKYEMLNLKDSMKYFILYAIHGLKRHYS